MTMKISRKIESELMVLEAIAHHFTNPFCARTNNGKVMYEKEIMNLINMVTAKKNIRLYHKKIEK